MATLHCLTRGSVPSLLLSRWRHGIRAASFHTSSPLMKRAPSEKRLPLSSFESEKAQALLRKGCQVWDIARSMGRSEPAVKLALKESGKLAKLLQADRSVPNKKQLAKEMGRMVKSVTAQLTKLARQREFDALLSSTVAHPVVKLNKAETACLRCRLDRILEGLEKAKKTEEWDRVLKETPRAEWVERILALIPPAVGRILAAPSPPTTAQLGSLGWNDTSDLGLYAWILPPKLRNPFHPEDYLYIGSATRYAWGLSGRRIRTPDKKGPFVTLLSMKAASGEPREVVKARQLIVFAEAVLTIWLDAFTRTGIEIRDSENQWLRLRGLCPWDLERIPCRGICSHLPLVVDITYPTGYEPLVPTSFAEGRIRCCL